MVVGLLDHGKEDDFIFVAFFVDCPVRVSGVDR